ncbi:M24 family metallopeptidase [Bacillus taeanensis]|uniref:Aminopeptidase P family protein n=1 Tax=Bacillus taeanensis TaxID=273032 RepID=A0A366XLX3_9BACI|nr:M24 family metallopeptidase [Bacillus taeanensis]RBW67370.1 aminopeptidase P family protein [Bacillus taeanensis]
MMEKLASLLENDKVLLIERQEDFSWLLKGRGHIGLASGKSCGALLISNNDCILLSNNIELQRLVNEEIKGEVIEYEFPWYDEAKRKEILDRLTAGRELIDDTMLAAEFKKLRTTLTNPEKEHYKKAARLTGEAVESVCYRLKVGMTEYEAAGEVAKELYARGLDPVVTLIGSDERLDGVRHFLPTLKPIKRKVIISVVSRSQGLMSSVTRTIYFEAPTEEEKRKMHAVQYVDAQLIAASKTGVSFSALFKNIQSWYEEAGFAGEWQNHHQGGLTGFLPREERVMLSSSFEIGQNQAYAWNPSVPGAKSEDTILLNENENEIITLTGNFPTTTFNVNGVSVVRPTYIQQTSWY